MMEPVTLKQLLKQAQPYERQPVPLPLSLRKTSWISIAAIGIGNVVYQALPSSLKIMSSNIIVLMDDWLAFLAGRIHYYHWEIQQVNLYALLLAAVLVILTKRFSRGRWLLQSLALPLVVVGALNALVLGILVSIVAVNLLVWSLAIIPMVAFLAFVLYDVIGVG